MGSHLNKAILIILAVVFLFATVTADEANCPAERTSNKGVEAIGHFHEIIAPVWHGSWAEKDYDALLAVGPEFTKAFQAIAELKPEFKTEDRFNRFLENRDNFRKMVQQYDAACTAGDKNKVYKLMPGLHDAFEMTASSLLPIHYAEFDGLVVTLNMILENHQPQNNTAGITGSTETLMAKMDGLNEQTIPADLQSSKEAILKTFSLMKEEITRMKECCDKNDMTGYKTHIEQLNVIVAGFIEKYI